ncbi:MAG: amidase [Alphaproteobacteria bacterium]|jgi:aspartyl-tRNA(Asn)/glutamyl-tRNA(Gln) amidotransferase subunit A|nr:amidase [Alphaproteobacteria bacterium]
MSEDIATLSLTEAAAAIAAKEISSLEVTEASLARIERLQPVLNCFISLQAEAALAAARAADARLAKGEAVGPLHGVPLAHKDMFYRAGRVSTCGSAIRRDFRPEITATVLTRLDAAGALDLGGLNMSEFANGPTGHNIHFGDCHNPWNPAHVTGGSSSGSGSAVAARLVYGTLGSDTGGSVRIPAALNGLVGLKPTQARISRHGGLPLSFSTDCFGPLTRTVADCARLTAVIAGHDPRDPTSSRRPVDDYEASLEAGIAGTTIAVARTYGSIEVVPEVAAASAESLAVLTDLGAETVEVDLPDPAELSALSNIVSRAEAAASHRQWIRTRRQDYSPQVRRRMEVGHMIPATRYIEALSARARILDEFAQAVFAEAEVLHLPTVAVPAPRIDESDIGDSETLPQLLLSLTGLTRPMNYLGLPALSLPAGFSADGLPVAFQLVGRPFQEAMLFRIGHAYQRATVWHRRTPPLASPE